MRRGQVEARLHGGNGRLDEPIALLAAEKPANDVREFFLAHAQQAAEKAHAHHVHPTAGFLRRGVQRQAEDLAGCFLHHRRHVARGLVHDDENVLVQVDLADETVEVLPVGGEQHVEGVVVRFQRIVRDAQQGRRFAASYLRPHGAGEQAIETIAGDGAQQQVAGGQHAGATGAGKRQRDGVAGDGSRHGQQSFKCGFSGRLRPDRESNRNGTCRTAPFQYMVPQRVRNHAAR